MAEAEAGDHPNSAADSMDLNLGPEFEPTLARLITLVPGAKVLGDRFVLERPLGRGGMGIVWLAKDSQLEDREVALKFLPDELFADEVSRMSLKSEALKALMLTHPNIVRAYDYLEDDKCAALSMEFVDGPTMAKMALDKSHRVFEAEELLPYLEQICAALTYAHEEKVIHRDLKPANLMVDHRDRLKVCDFGIARVMRDSLTQVTGRSTTGTLSYMSPQQLFGERASPKDDIYSVGATLYQLLTSRPPFYSGSIEMQIQNRLAPSIAERREELEITSPTPVPQKWENLIASCLAKEPQDRPSSPHEILAQLKPTHLSPAPRKTSPPKNNNNENPSTQPHAIDDLAGGETLAREAPTPKLKPLEPATKTADYIQIPIAARPEAEEKTTHFLLDPRHHLFAAYFILVLIAISELAFAGRLAISLFLTVYGIWGLIVGFVAQLIVGWRFPFGVLGTSVAGSLVIGLSAVLPAVVLAQGSTANDSQELLVLAPFPATITLLIIIRLARRNTRPSEPGIRRKILSECFAWFYDRDWTARISACRPRNIPSIILAASRILITLLYLFSLAHALSTGYSEPYAQGSYILSGLGLEHEYAPYTTDIGACAMFLITLSVIAILSGLFLRHALALLSIYLLIVMNNSIDIPTLLALLYLGLLAIYHAGRPRLWGPWKSRGQQRQHPAGAGGQHRRRSQPHEV